MARHVSIASIAIPIDFDGLLVLCRRVAPQPLVRDQTCSQCNGRMEAEDEFCWNLQCPGCPANLDPWDNQAANVVRVVVHRQQFLESVVPAERL